MVSCGAIDYEVELKSTGHTALIKGKKSADIAADSGRKKVHALSQTALIQEGAVLERKDW